MDHDTFWQSTHPGGWRIQGKHNRTLGREEIEIISPASKFIKHRAKSLDGARRTIERIKKGKQQCKPTSP